jgi:hypothetical protein
MSRRHALRGVSAVVLEFALMAPATIGYAPTEAGRGAARYSGFDLGIDNLFNEQYFLFRPFPGRTYVLAAKYTF